MNAASYVDQAREWAAFLESSEGCNDLEAARSRLERRYGIPSGVFYSLRHRPPKTVSADLYDKLAHAVEDSATTHMRKLENEIVEARARRLRPNGHSVRTAAFALERALELMGEVEK